MNQDAAFCLTNLSQIRKNVNEGNKKPESKI